MKEPNYQKNGERLIAAAIAKTHDEGKSVTVITGDYEISETVFLPSDTTLILRDCRLRMADGTFCVMFANENAYNPGIRDRNISVKGEGIAILDGGTYNGLSESTSNKNGMPHIRVNNTIFFVGVDKIEISGLLVKNQRWWAFNIIDCAYGWIHNIEFAADATRVDPETGERVHGLLRGHYAETYVKNADGIDIRLGCHDFLIENVTGFTEDDTVAITAIAHDTEKTMMPGDLFCNEIRNIVIRNIRACAYCTIIRILNQGGTRIQNVLVDGVYDASKGDDRLDRGLMGVRVGDDHLYGNAPSTGDETCNITIRNVVSRAKQALNLRGTIKNLVVESIAGFDGCETVIDNQATVI